MNKVLIITNHDIGLYKFRRELLAELVKIYEVYIVLPKGIYTDEIVAMGCHTLNVEIDRRGKNIFKDLLLIHKYRKFIKMISPDVILGYTIKPNIYIGLLTRKTNIPFLPNVTGIGTVMQEESLVKLVIIQLYKLAFSKAHVVFFQNKYNLEKFLEYRLLHGSYKLLPGSGVNLQEYQILPYPQSEPINFVFIGRIMKEKGVDEYIELAKYVKKRYPNSYFYACGFIDDKEYSDTIKFLQQDEIINYLGNIDNVMEIIGKSHCVIHPSYHEGMSNVLLEAAACGRPAIASRIPGCKEIIQDGVSGYLFEKKNIEQLKGCVEKFIKLSNEQRERMGQNARQHVELNFDRNIIVESYLKEIENAILEE
ncbi:glycosyltransferase family 4 protein [Facklamia sp. DSM 111018]|uniref:Glycosyltransferase family 4 protein n=1 Tax=Facklamia lactis TaxID=2749967 RepID=A0ABS0LMJ6_9LACT|nr:glycosyltransferase family 4 protein [Facklamia lactis]MBG9979956.1 glycosyltransferase family 4 protein [Facklamia lactis]MBG9985364.1 glycosyltransferase family 4 protein [Facklamia lactis]